MDSDDARLAERCRLGDMQAFAGLVERHQRMVYLAAYRLLGDRDDANDVAQATLLKVFEKIESFDPRYKFKSWVYRIAVNESIDLINHRKRTRPLPPRQASPERGPEQVTRSDSATQAVQAALAGLSDDYRTVVVLKHFLGSSYQEISEILGVPTKTVKSRLYTARQQLKARLEGEGLL